LKIKCVTFYGFSDNFWVVFVFCFLTKTGLYFVGIQGVVIHFQRIFEIDGKKESKLHSPFFKEV